MNNLLKIKKCLKFCLESIVQGLECVNQPLSLEKCDVRLPQARRGPFLCTK